MLEGGSQEAFGAAVGVSERNIWAIENAREVGDSSLEAVGFFLGQHLHGWSIDTPRLILEGEPVPELSLTDPEKPAKVRKDVAFNNVKVNIHSLASHSPEVRAALLQVTRLRKIHGAAGITDTLLLDAVEQALNDDEK